MTETDYRIIRERLDRLEVRINLLEIRMQESLTKAGLAPDYALVNGSLSDPSMSQVWREKND